jgi:hypothetical protein
MAPILDYGPGQRRFFRSLEYVSSLTASLPLFPVHQLGAGSYH